MMKWSSEGMEAKLSIYVNFSRPWKSCAYCKAKVHLTTLTSQYYMDKAHAEWKPPLAETGNEKWQILSEVSPRGIRPETLRFCIPVLYNGSYITGNSMVLCLDGLRCGASGNTKSRGLEFDCRRKTQISSLSLVHDKTQGSE